MPEPTPNEIIEMGRLLDENNVPTRGRIAHYLNEQGEVCVFSFDLYDDLGDKDEF